MTELLGNPANFRRVVAEYAETATGGGYWLTVDMQSGQTAEHATAEPGDRRCPQRGPQGGPGWHEHHHPARMAWPGRFVPPELGT